MSAACTCAEGAPPSRYDVGYPPSLAPGATHDPNDTQDHQAGRPGNAAESTDLTRHARAARQASRGIHRAAPPLPWHIRSRLRARRRRRRGETLEATRGRRRPPDAQGRTRRTHVAQRRRPRRRIALGGACKSFVAAAARAGRGACGRDRGSNEAGVHAARHAEIRHAREACARREAAVGFRATAIVLTAHETHVVATLGVRVSPHARIDIDRAAAHHQSELVTILLNKPIGYVSGQAEDGHTPAMALIKPENRWADDASPTRFKPGHLRGLAPAGRLDIDSTGLIVFTQDGRIAKNLIGRDSAVEKEYLVRVEGSLPDQAMKLLQRGLELDGVKLRPARVSWQNDDQLRFVLREGRKRQIRRMCELVGLAVTGLKRVRSGGVPLGPLPVGQWRYLRRDEKF